MQLIGKAGDWSARTEEYDKKFKETKVVGKGWQIGVNHYCVSPDLSLADLKTKAKAQGMTIGELFNTAAVVAYSKLDLPEDRKPAQLNTFQACSIWPNETSQDENFQPTNNITLWPFTFVP